MINSEDEDEDDGDVRVGVDLDAQIADEGEQVQVALPRVSLQPPIGGQASGDIVFGRFTDRHACRELVQFGLPSRDLGLRALKLLIAELHQLGGRREHVLFHPLPGGFLLVLSGGWRGIFGGLVLLLLVLAEDDGFLAQLELLRGLLPLAYHLRIDLLQARLLEQSTQFVNLEAINL